MRQIEDIALKALSACIVILMCAIVLQVICSALDINPLMRFEFDLFLIGRAVTLNSLLDFQWHLLVMVGLLPAGLVWLRDRHVRVDFLFKSRSAPWQARIDLMGNVIFASVFFALMLPASVNFMVRAWHSDEASRNGGLNDLWLIKLFLPLGLAVLAVYIMIDTWRLIRGAR